MSFVLLWQPSDCTDLLVIDYIFVLFSKNKYDDDDEGGGYVFVSVCLLVGFTVCLFVSDGQVSFFNLTKFDHYTEESKKSLHTELPS